MVGTGEGTWLLMLGDVLGVEFVFFHEIIIGEYRWYLSRFYYLAKSLLFIPEKLAHTVNKNLIIHYYRFRIVK